MKTYRELYFRGTPTDLEKFLCDIKSFSTEKWRFGKEDRYGLEWIYFDYLGDAVDNARVCITAGRYISSGELNVSNIVPLEKNQLSVDEYNAVLQKFYDDIIKPYKQINHNLDIPQPSDDVFDPKTVITEEALRKLEAFCNGANKSTGSSHPSDQERWFDFICQTVDDGQMFDYSTLAEFLQDETYWGTKDSDFLGVMGHFAWGEDQAYQLASEYENACILLEYYKRTRG